VFDHSYPTYVFSGPPREIHIDKINTWRDETTYMEVGFPDRGTWEFDPTSTPSLVMSIDALVVIFTAVFFTLLLFLILHKVLPYLLLQDRHSKVAALITGGTWGDDLLTLLLGLVMTLVAARVVFPSSALASLFWLSISGVISIFFVYRFYRWYMTFRIKETAFRMASWICTMQGMEFVEYILEPGHIELRFHHTLGGTGEDLTFILDSHSDAIHVRVDRDGYDEVRSRAVLLKMKIAGVMNGSGSPWKVEGDHFVSKLPYKATRRDLSKLMSILVSRRHFRRGDDSPEEVVSGMKVPVAEQVE